MESPIIVPTVSGEGGLSARAAQAANEQAAAAKKMGAVLRQSADRVRDGVKPDDSLERRGDNNPSILYARWEACKRLMKIHGSG
jgi:hypothetical protein